MAVSPEESMVFTVAPQALSSPDPEHPTYDVCSVDSAVLDMWISRFEKSPTLERQRGLDGDAQAL